MPLLVIFSNRRCPKGNLGPLWGYRGILGPYGGYRGILGPYGGTGEPKVPQKGGGQGDQRAGPKMPQRGIDGC